MYDIDKSRNSKILYVACHHPSKYDITETLRPILIVGLELTHDLELIYLRSARGRFLFHYPS